MKTLSYLTILVIPEATSPVSTQCIAFFTEGCLRVRFSLRERKETLTERERECSSDCTSKSDESMAVRQPEARRPVRVIHSSMLSLKGRLATYIYHC